MKRVIAFGAFDPLTEGQKDFIRQAKALGDHLTVVVAHDSAIRAHKGRDPKFSEEERMEAVRKLHLADDVVLGRKTANKYHVMTEIDFDVLAMGYNQKPSDAEVRKELEHMGKYNVEIIRCKEYKIGNEVSKPTMNRTMVLTTLVVVLLVLFGIFMALNSAGRSSQKEEASATPIKMRLNVVGGGWKTITVEGVSVYLPIGLPMKATQADYVLRDELPSASVYSAGTTVIAVVQAQAERDRLAEFMQQQTSLCKDSSVSDMRTYVLCDKASGRYGYITGENLDVFLDASTRENGTSEDLTDEEFVEVINKIDF